MNSSVSHLVICIDCSSDVESTVSTLKTFLLHQKINKSVLISIVVFGVEVMVALNHCELANIDRIANALLRAEPCEECDLEQGILGCLLEVNITKGTPRSSSQDPLCKNTTHLLLFTSGSASLGTTDTTSILASVSIALDSKAQDFTLHVFGVGKDGQNSELLENLACIRKTGSYHFTPTNACLLEALVDVLGGRNSTIMIASERAPPRVIPSLPSSVLGNFTDMISCSSPELWESISARLQESTEMMPSPHHQKMVHLMSSLKFDSLKHFDWPMHCARCLAFSSEEFIAVLATWVHEKGVTLPRRKQRSRRWPSQSAAIEEEEGGQTDIDETVFARRFKVSQDLIGKGAYGSLRMARDVKTGSEVAVKQITYVNKTRSSLVLALRELRLMRQLCKHKNIVTMYGAEVQCHSDQSADLWLAMELFSIDLQQLIDSNQVLSERHYSCIIFQVLCGLDYMHSLGVVHRDLKPGNLLLDDKCNLRICDFGLSRSVHEESELTEYVVTRWYRAPEVIQSLQYGPPVDVWSVGCIFYELVNRKPLVPGRDPKHQLQLIAALSLPGQDSASMLMKQMLIETPRARITAAQALKDDYFQKQGLDPLHAPQQRGDQEGKQCEDSDTASSPSNESQLDERSLLDLLIQETLNEI